MILGELSNEALFYTSNITCKANPPPAPPLLLSLKQVPNNCQKKHAKKNIPKKTNVPKLTQKTETPSLSFNNNNNKNNTLFILKIITSLTDPQIALANLGGSVIFKGITKYSKHIITFPFPLPSYPPPPHPLLHPPSSLPKISGNSLRTHQ